MQLYRAIFLAVLLSAGSIAILGHGFFNTGPIFTGIIAAGSTLALVFLGQWRSNVFDKTWRPLRVDRYDLCFVFFAGCIVASLVINGKTAAPKEIMLMLLTLAAYPAGRAIASGSISPGFAIVTGTVVAIGVAVTVPALLEQWGDEHGKPLVFGQFDGAAAQFAISMSFMLIALVSTNLSARSTALIALLLTIPSIVFSASIVRFAFIALASTLAVSILVRPRGQRKYVVVVLGTLVVSVLAGAAVRSEATIDYLRLTASTVSAGANAKVKIDPDCPGLNIKNSLAIRKQLYADAFAVLPEAGVLGLGLDSFMKRTCLREHEVHNTLLQTIVEFGWPAGVALALLIFAGVNWKMMTLAHHDAEAHFVFCGLIFVVLLGMVHGRISREAPLFLFLGYAAAIRTNSISILAARTTARGIFSIRG